MSWFCTDHNKLKEKADFFQEESEKWRHEANRFREKSDDWFNCSTRLNNENAHLHQELIKYKEQHQANDGKVIMPVEWHEKNTRELAAMKQEIAYFKKAEQEWKAASLKLGVECEELKAKLIGEKKRSVHASTASTFVGKHNYPLCHDCVNRRESFEQLAEQERYFRTMNSLHAETCKSTDWALLLKNLELAVGEFKNQRLTTKSMMNFLEELDELIEGEQ